MKKIYAIISGLILILLASTSVFADDVINSKIEVANVEADSATEVEVPVSISDNVGICGATLTISFDSDLVLKGISRGDGLSSLVMTKPGDLSMNPVKVLFDGETADTSNGVMFMLKFETPEKGGVFQIAITCEEGDVIDGDINPVSVEITNGSITVNDTRTDQERADEVVEKINAIDVNDKESVALARQLYNALTDDQKALIDPEILQKLEEAENTIRIAEENQEKSNEVTQIINGMDPANKEEVASARAAFDNLTDDQKNLVDPEVLKKLTDAEDAIHAAEEKEREDKEAAEAVTSFINGMDPDSEEAVAEARGKYDQLTDDQKALIDADVLKKLTDAEAEIEKLKQAREDQAAADAVMELIRALPDKATVEDEAVVKEAMDRYNALTEQQKKLVSDELVTKLETADKQVERAKEEAQKSEEEKKEDQKNASIVTGKINALPETVNIAYESDVIEAREAFNNLTEAQKDLVDNATVAKLESAETKIEEAKAANPTEEDIKKAEDEKAEADKKASEDVEGKLNSLPESVKVEDEDTITDARIAYEVLTSAQKALVSEESLKKLTAVEANLETAKAGSGNGNEVKPETPKETSGTDTKKPSTPTTSTANNDAYAKAVKAAKAIKISGLKARALTKRRAKVTWKVSKKVTGYQIQYSTDKKYKKSYKFTKVKGKTKKAATLKKLVEKKTYYIRIRPYTSVKNASGKKETIYGKWSKSVKIKAKK